jgi:hypothetical protein
MNCFAKGRHRPCYGRLTVHHIIAQARLRREHASLSAAYRRGEGPRPWSLTKALKDERNLREVCWGCHQCVEAGSIPVELSDLPEGFFEFVSEYRLAGLLPRHLRWEWWHA